MTGPRSWFLKGHRPLPPALSDKLHDWQALAAAGGQPILARRCVLDAGPAFGIDAQMLAPFCARYILLDTDEAVLRHVWDRAPSAEPMPGDCRAMPIDDASVDVVLDFGTFDNCGDPVAAYREAARVLRHDGTLVTSFAAGDGHSPSGDEVRLDPDDLRALLDGIGLRVFWKGGDRARACFAARRVR